MLSKQLLLFFFINTLTYSSQLTPFVVCTISRHSRCLPREAGSKWIPGHTSLDHHTSEKPPSSVYFVCFSFTWSAAQVPRTPVKTSDGKDNGRPPTPFFTSTMPKETCSLPGLQRELWDSLGTYLEYNLNWKLSRHLKNASSTLFLSSVEIGDAGKSVFVNTEGQNRIWFSH